MGIKRRTPAQIIRMLKQADILSGQGKTVANICRELGISDATYYKWRKSYGGLSVDQAKRLKVLEEENRRLKMVVADLTLDNRILKDTSEGNF